MTHSIKTLAATAISSLALAFSTPLKAQDEAAGTDAAAAPLDEIAGMMSGLFEAEPLTPEQEARVPKATAVVSAMMPEGFYAEMMGDMMDTMLEPMLGAMSGEAGARIVLLTRLDMDPSVVSGIAPEQKVELATMLDPGFEERGEVMKSFLGNVMLEASVLVEPLYREGLAKAYAVRFTDAQLEDIATFFKTPTGAVYATENMKLMADPQVMAANMQAMPAMMKQMGGMTASIEQAMAQMPPENSYEDLTPTQRARMSELLGVPAETLADVMMAPEPKSRGAGM